MIQHFRRQSGISMVEIMVALVLSLMLSAGVLEVFLSSKQSYRTQEGFSRLQENARYAIETAGRYIRYTGYKINPLDTNAVFVASGSFADQQFITGTDGGNAASDSVTFRYQDDGLLGDCQTSPPGAAAADTVRINTLSINNNKELVCTDVVAVTTQPLVEGVENMQILYGIDTDTTDNVTAANRYVTAAYFATASDWSLVVSIRISLLLNTLENVSSEADTATWNLVALGMATGDPTNFTIAAPGSTDATRYYRRHFFTTTINLRNNSL